MINNLNDDIKDKLTKVCVCKSITRKSIKDSINNGAKTVDEVKNITGAGTGSCKGCRCVLKIKELLKK